MASGPEAPRSNKPLGDANAEGPRVARGVSRCCPRSAARTSLHTQHKYLLPDAYPLDCHLRPQTPTALGLTPSRVQTSDRPPVPAVSSRNETRVPPSDPQPCTTAHPLLPPVWQRERSNPLKHAHAHTHTRTCARAHTPTRVHDHTRTHAHIHTPTGVLCIHACTHMGTCTCMHTCHICCTRGQPRSWPSVNSRVARLGSRSSPACSEAPRPLRASRGPRA